MFKCLRCGHEWSAQRYSRRMDLWRSAEPFTPKRCAKCRSPYWNKRVQRNRTGQSHQMRCRQ
jgi:hypothetical protein